MHSFGYIICCIVFTLINQILFCLLVFQEFGQNPRPDHLRASRFEILLSVWTSKAHSLF